TLAKSRIVLALLSMFAENSDAFVDFTQRFVWSYEQDFPLVTVDGFQIVFQVSFHLSLWPPLVRFP
ncbi:hypothetical protein SK128_003778, partial [Halocaridina rubra]